MTAKELAQALDGVKYGNERTGPHVRAAKESGLVIVFGESDDGIEFCGAIDDETDVYNGGTVYVTPSGIVPAGTPNARRLDALWRYPDSGASWTYKADFPYETFRIFDSVELYCIGIVFDIADLGRPDAHAILSNALLCFGKEHQMLKAVEELAELQRSISRFMQGEGDAEAVADETADVEIMLAQIKMIFGNAEAVEQHREYKLCRLNGRLAPLLAHNE